MSGIMLGNLNIEEMERRTGVEWPAELKEYMEDKHQSRATNIGNGKWHCFDAPFMLVCGDMETAQKIYDYLKPINSEFKEIMQIGLSN